MNHLGERLQEIRKNKNLTQNEFGKLFGVTHAHISSIERGKEKPSEMFILFISEKFQINIEWLRNGIGDMYFSESFNVFTDEGNRIKFEYLNKQLVELIEKSNGNDLKTIVKILSYFQSSLISKKDFNENVSNIYLQELCDIVVLIDKMIADANGLSIMKEHKENYKTLLKFASQSNHAINDIQLHMKNILNLYIDKYLDIEQLGYKIFE